MIAYKFDGTFDGILCCIYKAFADKEDPYILFSTDFQPSFDTTVKEVETSGDIAKRVSRGIVKCGSIGLLSDFSYAMRSGDGLKDTIIFKAIKKCLSAGKNVTENYADYDMLAFYDLKKRISFETHRLKGFLRFERCAGGGLYAHLTPDNDICDLLLPHFKARFPSEKFIIHDVKRNVIAIYDGKDTAIFCGKTPLTVYIDEGEPDVKSLWKTYYSAVNIKERKNKKLQDNYLPRRYRKNMSEFL